MNGSELESRMKAVEHLTRLFKMERMVHLAVTTISLVMLLFSTGFLLVKAQASPTILTLMFGSSGLITYSANRLLRMWDQALKILISKQEEKN